MLAVGLDGAVVRVLSLRIRIHRLISPDAGTTVHAANATGFPQPIGKPMIDDQYAGYHCQGE